MDVQGDGVITGHLNLGNGTNVFVGNGGLNAVSCCHIVVGRDAGLNITTSNSNTFFGFRAGMVNKSSDNVFLGVGAGETDTTETRNIFIVTQAGYVNKNGFANVFIGLRSGLTNVNGARFNSGW